MPTKNPFELIYARNLLGNLSQLPGWGYRMQRLSEQKRIVDLFSLTPLESCLVKGFPFPISVDDCLVRVVPYLPAPPSEVCLDRGPPDALFQTGSDSTFASDDTFLRGSLVADERLESWDEELLLYEKLDGKESDTGRRDSAEK